MNTLALAVAASVWLADGVLERIASQQAAMAGRAGFDTGASSGLDVGLACTGVLAAAGVGDDVAALLADDPWRSVGLGVGYVAALVALRFVGASPTGLKQGRTTRAASLALVAVTAAALFLAALVQGVHGSLVLAAIGTVFTLLLAAFRALRTQTGAGVGPWRSALVATVAAVVLDGLLQPWGAS